MGSDVINADELGMMLSAIGLVAFVVWAVADMALEIWRKRRP